MRISLAAIAGFIWIACSVAYACTCIPNPPPKEALAKSTAVFSGKVTKVADAGDLELDVTIDVATVWKGGVKEQIVVRTHSQSAACGYGFEKGKSYLVYANDVKEGETKRLSASICSRTALLSEAKEDLAELGPGTKVESKKE